MMPHTLEQGLPEALTDQAADLYEHAFGRKTGLIIPDAAKRKAFFLSVIDTRMCVCAVHENTLLGLAGYQDAEASFTGGMLGRGLSFSRVHKFLDPLPALRACLVSLLFLRKPGPGEIILDGIAVIPECRGAGVGGTILREVVNIAGRNGFQSVRLDVIDTNPKAHKFYLREGFQPVAVNRFEFLRGFLGFGATTTMKYQLLPDDRK